LFLPRACPAAGGTPLFVVYRAGAVAGETNLNGLFGCCGDRRALKRAGADDVLRVKPIAVACVLFFLGGAAFSAYGQGRVASEFQVTKISKNLITAPQFSYTGAQQYQANQRDRWLEVEVEFAAAPEFTMS
jgi:hypothetical protein